MYMYSPLEANATQSMAGTLKALVTSPTISSGALQ